MRKISRKIIQGSSVVMGSALLASPLVAQVASAAVSTDTKASIKATGLESNTQGTLYKIINVNWDNGQPKAPQYMWADSVEEWVKTNFPDYIKAEDGSVTDKFNKDLGDAGEVANHEPTDNGAATFYAKLTAAIKKGDITITGNDVTAQDGTITAADQEMGGYLIIFKDDMRVYRPSVVNVYPTSEDGGDWTLAPEFDVVVKSTQVPMTKSVDDEQVSIGNTVNFTIDATLPVYPKEAQSKVFNIFDTMPAGITLNKESIQVFGVDKTDAETKLAADTNYEVVDTDAKHPGATFGIKMKYDTVKQYEKIRVKYAGDINKNAVIGEANVNSAVVDFSNDPLSENNYKVGNTPVTTNDFTYGIDLSKTGESDEALSGATFTVMPKDGGAAIKLVKESDGVYHVADKTEEASADVNASVDSNGKLMIRGLDVGKYELTEVTAPNGYVKLQAPVEVDIEDANKDGIVDENASAQKGYLAVTIKNNKGFTWPVTGGKGTVMFTAIGAVVVSAGVIGAFAASKKRKVQE